MLAPDSRPADRPRGTATLRTVLVRVVAALVLVALIALTGVGWYYSDQIVRPTPHAPLEARVAVTAIDDTSITLAGTRAGRRGRVWFVEWPGGCGVAGDVITQDSTRVRRRSRVLDGRLTAGARVDLGAYPYSGDPRRVYGLLFEHVVIAAPSGTCPAWFIPGASETWVVLVHGMAAGRGEPLRMLPLLADLGFPSLTITYRNAPGAPRSRDGLYHLGATEWEDLEAGVRYARQHGARDVVLVGYSMGGAVVASFLRRSALAGSVVGVVLDSPVLDWDAAIRQASRKRRLPSFLTTLAEGVVSLRTGFRWGDAEGMARPDQFRTPVLIFHSRADRTVPVAASEALAAALRDRATFVSIEGAGHVQSWNFDPPRYEKELRQWLTRVVRGRWKP